MEQKIKFIIMGLAAILAISLFINLQGFAIKQKLEREREDLKKEIATLSAQVEDAANANRSLQQEIGNLKRKVEDISREKEAVQDKIKTITEERDDLVEKLKAKARVESDNETLKQQMRTLNESKSELDKKLSALQKENSDLNNKLSETEKLLEAKQQAQVEASQDLPLVVTSSGKSIELEPIVVRAQSEVAPAQAASYNAAAVKEADQSKMAQESSLAQEEITALGKILAVNKDNNFVVIDAGEESGLRVGDPLQVWRENFLVANLKVVQTRNKISACDIKAEFSQIKVGDSVK